MKQRLDRGEKFLFVDVREPWEHETSQIEGAKLIPLREIPANLGALEAAERRCSVLPSRDAQPRCGGVAAVAGRGRRTLDERRDRALGDGDRSERPTLLSAGRRRSAARRMTMRQKRAKKKSAKTPANAPRGRRPQAWSSSFISRRARPAERHASILRIAAWNCISGISTRSD